MQLQEEKNQKGNLRHLLQVMLKIGLIGFGGGTALIPVIEEEAVEEYHLVDEEEFHKDVIVANITPGALPVEIASRIGRKVGGFPGMFLAASCMALPGTLLTVLILSLINKSVDAILWQIMFASVGVSAYIIFMLEEYARSTYKECRKTHRAKRGLFLMAAVFYLTSGGELMDIFGIEGTPLFDVSIIQVLAVAFFAIFYTQGEHKHKKVIFAGVISAVYMLCVGDANLLPWDALEHGLQILMVVLALWGLIHSVQGSVEFSRKSFLSVLAEEGIWVLFLAVLSLPAFLLCGETLAYLLRGLLSAVLSFGGGDAYLAIADGMFVSSGLVSYSDFYHKIVSVSNALPGSILCKVLAGVGYVLGSGEGGSVFAGWAVALCGFACSVAASGMTVSAVAYIYERFESLGVLRLIKIYIKPIVSGLLLSVSASMIYQNMQIAADMEWPMVPVLLLTLIIFLLNLFWKTRGRVRPIFRVLLSAAIAWAACNGLLFLIG